MVDEEIFYHSIKIVHRTDYQNPKQSAFVAQINFSNRKLTESSAH